MCVRVTNVPERTGGQYQQCFLFCYTHGLTGRSSDARQSVHKRCTLTMQHKHLMADART
jgi:hypothetical protein